MVQPLQGGSSLSMNTVTLTLIAEPDSKSYFHMAKPKGEKKKIIQNKTFKLTV